MALGPTHSQTHGNTRAAAHRKNTEGWKVARCKVAGGKFINILKFMKNSSGIIFVLHFPPRSAKRTPNTNTLTRSVLLFNLSLAAFEIRSGGASTSPAHNLRSLTLALVPGHRCLFVRFHPHHQRRVIVIVISFSPPAFPMDSATTKGMICERAHQMLTSTAGHRPSPHERHHCPELEHLLFRTHFHPIITRGSALVSQ